MGTVLLVFMYVYAIAGMCWWGNIGPNPNLDEIDRHANFQSFPEAMLLLFRCTTGENWDKIMQ
eukprot:gene13790-19699_t